METLHAVIKDVKQYFKTNSINSFEPVVVKDKVTIEFELPVDSYVAPNKMERNFSFELTLWIDRGRRVASKITTKRRSHLPFHPHFEIKRDWLTGQSYAEWIGYAQGESAIRERIEHMLCSLQFKPGYINVEQESLIGNKKALFWFLREHYLNMDRFMAGNAQKKHFEVNTAQQHPVKKFDISQDNTASKKKFSIHQEIAFDPVKKRLPYYDVESSLDSLTDSLQSRSRIYISPSAREHIFSHIRWGDLNATETRSEQGGLLLGNIYYDEEAELYYGIAERGIPGRSAQGTATYLEMTHETWREMIDNVDRLLSAEEHKDLQIIGWYHTHPNELDVFMSGTDMNTQRNYFNQEWHFAIVLNPQKRIWKAFSGPRSLECKGFFLATGGSSGHYDDGDHTDNGEERGHYPGKQPIGPKKVFLLLALVALVIAAYVIITRSMNAPQR